jgi:Flp pilus assembly pilin Flp
MKTSRFRIYVQKEVQRMSGKRSEGGQGLVEYAFILILIALATIVGLILLEGGISNAFTNIIANL